ncbi:GNAT family N-acetyltransferase [Actinomarinicola tropica]|uniref:GNAT family N-acetyltransferase n=1 Tax=Actinomarinicola tropica TaxID=2789776 RepID=A0A5Q2RR20_9ACTN|nr:GNAT family N-acetyltransferase [Actinomarinicola tropica]QGG96886.1 GNAT family N-acetyltransferase [Actinomarinicola tropica]
MRQYEHLQCGPDRLRVGRWRADPSVAELTSLVGTRPPERHSVEKGLELIASRGFRRVVTNALSPAEQVGYIRAGFQVHERLHLLAHDLRDIPPAPTGAVLRRGHRWDHPALLAVDAAAFDPFWRLDAAGLRDAIAATPSSRLRVARVDGVAGYAVTGRAGGRGYLQRLAVHPERHRHGIGTALVVDALRWLRRHGGTMALVNTQEVNGPALHLYRSLGFTDRPDGLAVLSFEFGS